MSKKINFFYSFYFYNIIFMKSILLIALLLTQWFFSYTYADWHWDHMSEDSTINSNNDIVENALLSPDHTTLVAAVKAAGLVDTLQSEWPFTVFAPTNSAFNALPEWTVSSLLEPKNKWDLTSVLTYHVVAGKYMAWDIYDGLKLKTVQGQDILFTINDGKVYLNWTSMVSAVDLDSSNWVIHVIDSVILPKSDYNERLKRSIELRSMLNDRHEKIVEDIMIKISNIFKKYNTYEQIQMKNMFIWKIDKKLSEGCTNLNLLKVLELLKLEMLNDNYPYTSFSGDDFYNSKDIVDNLVESDNHSTLVTAVVSANLVDVLKGKWPFTVFAPDNSAFSKLPEWTVETLLEKENIDTLTSILTYHVVPWIYSSSDIYDGLKLTTLQGTDLEFTIKNSNVYINWTSMLKAVDLPNSNWMIHVISEVVQP